MSEPGSPRPGHSLLRSFVSCLFYCLTIKTGGLISSESSVIFYRTTRHYTPEYCVLYLKEIPVSRGWWEEERCTSLLSLRLVFSCSTPCCINEQLSSKILNANLVSTLQYTAQICCMMGGKIKPLRMRQAEKRIIEGEAYILSYSRVNSTVFGQRKEPP
jgi:hypothetical protein